MENLEKLYFDQIKDIYDAEMRLVEALPKMEKEASNPQLQMAIKGHLEETKEQVDRLERIFEIHNMKPERKTCAAMKGLVEEGEKELKEFKIPEVKDAALIASAQRVEHYEMSGYGTLKTYAATLGFEEDVKLLSKTLDEEKAADEKLNDIALSVVNIDALNADEDDDDFKKSSSKSQGSRARV